MYIKKFLSENKYTLVYFFFWRVSLFIIAYFSVIIIPKFGASFPYWERLLQQTGFPPWIWGFGNFDGVHYLGISMHGYFADFTQAFFPLYPFIISLTAGFIRFIGSVLIINIGDVTNYFISANLVSNITALLLFVSIFKFYNLFTDKNKSFKALLLFILFPTSFYLVAVYSEGLFLLLSVVALFFIHKKKFLIASLLIFIATATRVVGIALVIALIIKIIEINRGSSVRSNKLIKYLLLILISSGGLILYMLYLWNEFGDPLYFLTSQSSFGAGRSSSPIILLPQVIYRYFKMFVTVNPLSYKYFNMVTEFIFGVFPFLLILKYWKKIPLYLNAFMLIALLMPTLTGSFLSMPRFTLVLFPMFPYLVDTFYKKIKYLYMMFFFMQILFFVLFIRGYWIS